MCIVIWMMTVFVFYRVLLWQTVCIDLSNLNKIIVLIDVCFDWISIVRLRVSATHSQHRQSQSLLWPSLLSLYPSSEQPLSLIDGMYIEQWGRWYFSSQQNVLIRLTNIQPHKSQSRFSVSKKKKKKCCVRNFFFDNNFKFYANI